MGFWGIVTPSPTGTELDGATAHAQSTDGMEVGAHHFRCSARVLRHLALAEPNFLREVEQGDDWRRDLSGRAR